MLDAYLAGDDKKMMALDEKQRADSLKAGYTAKEYDAFMNEILYTRNAAGSRRSRRCTRQAAGSSPSGRYT